MQDFIFSLSLSLSLSLWVVLVLDVSFEDGASAYAETPRLKMLRPRQTIGMSVEVKREPSAMLTFSPKGVYLMDHRSPPRQVSMKKLAQSPKFIADIHPRRIVGW